MTLKNIYDYFFLISVFHNYDIIFVLVTSVGIVYEAKNFRGV